MGTDCLRGMEFAIIKFWLASGDSYTSMSMLNYTRNINFSKHFYVYNIFYCNTHTQSRVATMIHFSILG